MSTPVPPEENVQQETPAAPNSPEAGNAKTGSSEKVDVAPPSPDPTKIEPKVRQPETKPKVPTPTVKLYSSILSIGTATDVVRVRVSGKNAGGAEVFYGERQIRSRPYFRSHLRAWRQATSADLKEDGENVTFRYIGFDANGSESEPGESTLWISPDVVADISTEPERRNSGERDEQEALRKRIEVIEQKLKGTASLDEQKQLRSELDALKTQVHQGFETAKKEADARHDVLVKRFDALSASAKTDDGGKPKEQGKQESPCASKWYHDIGTSISWFVFGLIALVGLILGIVALNKPKDADVNYLASLNKLDQPIQLVVPANPPQPAAPANPATQDHPAHKTKLEISYGDVPPVTMTKSEQHDEGPKPKIATAPAEKIVTVEETALQEPTQPDMQEQPEEKLCVYQPPVCGPQPQFEQTMYTQSIPLGRPIVGLHVGYRLHIAQTTVRCRDASFRSPRPVSIRSPRPCQRVVSCGRFWVPPDANHAFRSAWCPPRR